LLRDINYNTAEGFPGRGDQEIWPLIMEDENASSECSPGFTNINLEDSLPLIMEDDIENSSNESSPDLTNINLENSPHNNNRNIEDSIPLIMEDQNPMRFVQGSPNPQNPTSPESCHTVTGIFLNT